MATTIITIEWTKPSVSARAAVERLRSHGLTTMGFVSALLDPKSMDHYSLSDTDVQVVGCEK